MASVIAELNRAKTLLGSMQMTHATTGPATPFAFRNRGRNDYTRAYTDAAIAKIDGLIAAAMQGRAEPDAVERIGLAVGVVGNQATMMGMGPANAEKFADAARC